MTDAGTGRVHPVAGHLSAAADYLAAGRDLLHTHFFVDPAGARTGASYWAPVITSGPVTAALLAELAAYPQNLAPWIARQSGAHRIGWDKLTSAQLAPRRAGLGHHQPRQRAHPARPRRARWAARPGSRLPSPAAHRSLRHGPGLEILARRHRSVGHRHHRPSARRASHSRRHRNRRPGPADRTARLLQPALDTGLRQRQPDRDPAGLAQSSGDVITVLAAVHHAADAISWIAAADQAAVLDAVGNRLYVPTRLLPENYDIPHPYASAPRAYADALLAAYVTAIDATTHMTTALDNLATAVDAPSAVLAAARQASTTAKHDQHRQQNQQWASQPRVLAPVPGRTEQALRKLHIRDPALLLRAAVIDQAAHDLVAQAKAAAHSRDIVTAPASRPSPGARRSADRPAHVASQDTGRAPARTARQSHSSTITPGTSPGRSHPAPHGRSGRLTR